MQSTTKIENLEAVHKDSQTRLGAGATVAERSAVRDGITSLFYHQGHVTVGQSGVIVHTAILAAERTRKV